MRLLRVVLGAALLATAVPLATASHARCAPDVAVVCSTVYRTCVTARDAIGSRTSCPVF